MAGVRANLVANVLGRGWAAAVSLLLIPVYLRFLGIEAFGLIGFYATVLAVTTLFDFGLGPMLTRRLAQVTASGEPDHQAVVLYRRVEVVSWLLGLCLGACLALAAPFIADHWLRLGGLRREVVIDALRLMALAIALRFPANCYAGALLGMHRHASLNLVLAVGGTAAGAGTIAALALHAPSIGVFFASQAVFSLAQTLVLGFVAHAAVPRPRAALEPSVRGFVAEARFAIGMSGISLTALALTQMDKILLSRLIPLEAFGSYSLAAMLASGLGLLAAPFYLTMLPTLSRLTEAGESRSLATYYHTACEAIAVAVLPAGAVLVVYAREILYVWSGNAEIAASTALVLSLLAAGGACNGLMQLPYALQLAHGWTSLTISVNLAAIVLLVPLVILGAASYGPAGAAAGWFALNLSYLCVTIPLMHRRLLTNEQARWYVRDVGLPLTAAILAVIVTLWLPRPEGRAALGAWLALVLAIAYSATALAAPEVRRRGLRGFIGSPRA